MSRRLKYFARTSFKVGLLITCILALVRYGRPWFDKTANLPAFVTPKDKPMIRMAIINSVYYHSEVWYSYVYAAAIRAQFNVSLFTDVVPHSIHNENGFSYITRSWSRPYSYKIQQYASQLLNSITNTCSYQIFILTTLKVPELQSLLHTLLYHCDKKVRYILLIQIHNAAANMRPLEKCLNQFPKLFSKKHVEIRLLVLAHHVKTNILLSLKTPLSVDIWIPVFPVDLPATGENDEHHRYFDFVIQGHLTSSRRNYSGFINEIKGNAKVLDKHGIVFTIVGRSKNPEDYRRFQLGQVRLFIAPQMMPANIYYSLIHQSAGIIPLFAQDTYFNGTQSSSISTSFITRTPLLASQRLLNTHPHIPKESVWLTNDNETDMKAIIRIVTSYPSSTAFRDALFNKRQTLERMVESFCEENTRILNGYARSLTQSISLP